MKLAQDRQHPKGFASILTQVLLTLKYYIVCLFVCFLRISLSLCPCVVQLNSNVYGAPVESSMLERGNICTEAEDIVPTCEECSV